LRRTLFEAPSDDSCGASIITGAPSFSVADQKWSHPGHEYHATTEELPVIGSTHSPHSAHFISALGSRMVRMGRQRRCRREFARSWQNPPASECPPVTKSGGARKNFEPVFRLVHSEKRME